MINEQYPHSALTGKIIGGAMEVHRELGYFLHFGSRRLQFKRVMKPNKLIKKS